MSTFIEGKPLEEYIEEQKKKDGVIYVRRGTVINGHSKSVYNGGVISYVNDRDLRYEDADLSTRISGKTYRFVGDVVERRAGVWYVNGQKADLPKFETDEDLDAKIGQVQKTVDAAMRSAGIIHYGGSVRDRTVYTETNFVGRSSSGRRVNIRNGSVIIHRGGKTYTIKGKNIEKRDGQWFADGKPVSYDDIGGDYKESNVVSIEINGDVQNLSTVSGDVVVNGNVANISTASGDVSCTNADCVNTASGDVHVSGHTDSVSTISGNIYK